MKQNGLIALLGDVTADVYVSAGAVKYGGAALNMAMWAKRVGLKPQIVSAVGTDAIGNDFLKFMETESLSTKHVQQNKGTTSSVEIFLDKGERRYGKWKQGVLTHFRLRPIDFDAMQPADAIVMMAYPAFQNVLNDLNVWKKTLHPEDRPLFVVNYGDLKEFSGSIDIVKNYLDLADILVFGLDREADSALIESIDALSSPEKVIIVTLGKHGSMARRGTSTFAQLPVASEVVDTTGAGDSFIVGFVAHYLDSGDISGSLLGGATVAAHAIAKIGAY